MIIGDEKIVFFQVKTAAWSPGMIDFIYGLKYILIHNVLFLSWLVTEILGCQLLYFGGIFFCTDLATGQLLL